MFVLLEFEKKYSNECRENTEFLKLNFDWWKKVAFARIYLFQVAPKRDLPEWLWLAEIYEKLNYSFNYYYVAMR